MSTPGVNLTKFYPPVNDRPTPEETALHLRDLYDGTNDHDQAITTLKGQVDDLADTVATAAASTSTNTSTTITITEIEGFGNLAAVNDQTGQTSYTVQGTDNGALVALNDASAIAVTLNSVVMAPYFVFIANQGTGTVTLTASSGSINGTTTIPGGSSVTAFYDGANWWIYAVVVTPPIAYRWSNIFAGG